MGVVLWSFTVARSSVVQMEFKYAMKGEDGSELFEDGVVLARQYLGVGDWQVWDLRPNSARHCPKCSSQAERIVRHERGVRCPGTARSEGRVAAAREAIAKRAARLRELENDRSIARTLRRAQELDREAAAENEGEGDGEAEGEDAELVELAEAEVDPEVEEAVDEEAAEIPMVLVLFHDALAPRSFPVLRPHRPLHPLRPLQLQRCASLGPVALWLRDRLSVPRTRPFTRG